MKVFKIRKKGTDLFSSGGSSPRWTTKGKTWSSMAFVVSHLKNVQEPSWRRHPVYADAEIVEFSVSEVATTDVSTVRQKIVDAAAVKRKKQEDKAKKQMEEVELAQLRRLQAKYPSHPSPPSPPPSND